METKAVTITGIHPYTFRCGEAAIVLGVKKSANGEGRICYEVAYKDGYIDYIPLIDMHNYKME